MLRLMICSFEYRDLQKLIYISVTVNPPIYLHYFFYPNSYMEPIIQSFLYYENIINIHIQLISNKRFLECTLIQSRLSIYPQCTQVAQGTFFMKSPVFKRQLYTFWPDDCLKSQPWNQGSIYPLFDSTLVLIVIYILSYYIDREI